MNRLNLGFYSHKHSSTNSCGKQKLKCCSFGCYAAWASGSRVCLYSLMNMSMKSVQHI